MIMMQRPKKSDYIEQTELGRGVEWKPGKNKNMGPFNKKLLRIPR